jgi:CRISPR-associated endonuclease/helicase Cas3
MANTMTFPEFFSQVTKDADHSEGKKPYQWQVKVAELVLENKWSELLNVPTGCGKTMIVLIWYWCLYKQITDQTTRTVPMRLQYVINRRSVIIDLKREFTEISKKINEIIGKNLHLEIIEVRGGLGWKELMNTHSPAQPAIYICTLDGYGYRLLHRGYGMSPKMRSFHAGLAYLDSLVILDESHTVKSFKTLMERIGKIQDNKFPSILPPRIIRVSATDDDTLNQFPIEDLTADLRDLTKKKKIILHNTDNIPRLAVKLIQEALKDPANKCVACIVNTVSRQRQILALINSEMKNNKGKTTYLPPSRIHALNGQNRAARLLNKDMQLLQNFMSKRDQRDNQRLVIATQTIEMGVNYDFDVMISELASLPSLIQRGGRLDRYGKMAKEPEFHVMSDGRKDPIYGELAVTCLEFLKWKEKEKSLYFPLNPDKKSLAAKQFDTVPLYPSDVEKLSVTCPDLPMDVDYFIKGIEDYDTDVTIIFRGWLSEDKNEMQKQEILEELKQVGINPAEVLRIPLTSLQYTSRTDPDCDLIISNPTKRGKKEYSRLRECPCVVQRFGKLYFCERIAKVRPFDMVFLPVSYGGLDRWGWNIDCDKVFQGDIYNKIKNNKRYYTSEEEYEKALAEEKIVLKDYGEPISTVRGGVLLKPKRYFEKHKINPLGVSLENHTRLVEYYCRKFLIQLKLVDFMNDFLDAARYHDLGKADPRWQQYINGWGTPTNLLGKPLPEGKIGPSVSPLGWRHELLSLSILEDNNIQISPLTAHLIGSHHGYWRPYAPEVYDNSFRNFEFELFDRKWKSLKPFNQFVNKNFEELNTKYGSWGLSYLEVIFRLADHAASAHEGALPWKN